MLWRLMERCFPREAVVVIRVVVMGVTLPCGTEGQRSGLAPARALVQ